MLGKLALVVLLLASVASADSLKVYNYNVLFNMNQPHEVTLPQSVTLRNGSQVSEIYMVKINSSRGDVILNITATNSTTKKGFAEGTPTKSIEIDNKTGWYTVNSHNGDLVQTAMYYIRASQGADYYSPPSDSNTSNMTISTSITSNLPIYDFVDFLRTLHIEPIETKAATNSSSSK